MVGKPINPKSKGYDNLGWGSPKDLAKVHGNKEFEWAKEAWKQWNGIRKPKTA